MNCAITGGVASSRMLYLASQSPQRSAILASTGVAYRVVASAADEDHIVDPNPLAMALARARFKAKHALIADLLAGWSDQDVVLAADTVVALGDEVFGKPRDNADAERILTRLAGTQHTVATAHCCWRPAFDGRDEREASGVSVAKVTMRAMSPEDIKLYVATGESAERSGAYAIQETGDRFVTHVSGDRDTVVGLSMPMVSRLYREVTDHVLPGGSEDA